MRFSPIAIATAVTLMTVSSSGIAQQTRTVAINAQSLSWSAKGDAALKTGANADAADSYETALVIDPRNVNAYIGLGEIARQNGMSGKAIGYFRQALAFAPNNVAALTGQGLALVDKGAIDRAKANLTKAKSLCRGDCAGVTRLSAAINAGPPAAKVAAADQATMTDEKGTTTPVTPIP